MYADFFCLVDSHSQCSLVELPNSHWSLENTELSLCSKKYRAPVSQQEVQSSHWSMRNIQVSLVSKKYRALVGQQEVQSSHWSMGNIEVSLVSGKYKFHWSKRKYRWVNGNNSVDCLILILQYHLFWSIYNVLILLAKHYYYCLL